MEKRTVRDRKVCKFLLSLVIALFFLCSVSFFMTPIATAQTNVITWTGNGGNNLWSTPGNWSTNKVPTIYEGVVIIPEGVTVQVDIKNTPIRLQCDGNLSVDNNVIFSLTDGSYIKGKLTNNGTISFNKGTFTFSGGAQGYPAHTI